VSLILDALRKADAERERGAVPGLHAQPAELVAAAAPPARNAPPWLWAGGGLAVGVAIVIAWIALGRTAAPPASVERPGAPSAGGPAPAASTTPPPSLPSAPAPAAATMPPLMAEPAPWPQSDARKGGERAPAADAPAEAGAAPAPAPRVLTAESVPVAPEQLPAHIRAQLPQLTFGGSIYSSNPGSRSLIVNGRLHREADEVQPGLTLEQIKPKGAVFSFRGYRFEVLL
jgi:general secretion pathway protein B